MTRKPPTAVALGGFAAIRAFASIWLRRLDSGLTRQHVQSLVVAVAVVAGIGVAHPAKRVGARREPPAVASDRVANAPLEWAGP